ncbi:PilC/PilY family type IV pilus protein [Pseudomonas sp. dw_358]|uniref:pilus assembly protein n=1 Tax=Pseudomonas sp. dw_358 TaxID=2720083 RepID=UPI001BD48DF7|nr:PilC/PilY family type IV pilus protein [Pseudomonas sp. dw_358]
MPSADARALINKGRACLLGLIALCLSGSLWAFTPAASPLLSAAAVTPNLMLLVDNSGSMNSLIRATDFDQTATFPQVYVPSSCGFNRGVYSCSYNTALDMDNENLFQGNLSSGECSNSNYSAFKVAGSNSVYCLNIPDPVGGGNTRLSAKYMSYLIAKMTGTTKDYTDGSIPNDYRINVARNAATAIVKANTSLRIGLASYNAPRTGDSGPGGNITRVVSDLQATSTTTGAQATTNYNNLLTSIAGLGATSNTPLAETYYEVTRYMRGLYPFSNYNPTISGVRYTSPIQYRCQKNYGVVITDGLPTYDRTFPTSSADSSTGDPALASPETRTLPNWDGINNDGDNLNGDGEGDTLYLDDIAKFAYDIDMRSSGTDLAGKSWDATDFPQQNMLTYTVGFTTTQQMLSDAAGYGHGTYYQASDASTLAAALNNALSSINSKSGSGGAGSSSSSTLTSSTVYYQTLYDPTDWRGIIRAYPYNTDGSVGTTLNWTTDTTIVPASSLPTFESWNGTSVISLAYASFTTTQQGYLNANLPTGLTGNDLINWSKGTNKTGLRTRAVLLGDIINSPLSYVAPTAQTASNTTTDTTYTTYLTTKSTNMSPVLVVNANDGFTNVINPATGARLYAYLPSSALPTLYTVSSTSYVNGTSHTFLNDGQITVADVQINGGWKTVAFDGTGAGGKTFSAIQLFDAANSNVRKALWEISAPATSTTSNALNDLGYAYAKPEIARLPDGRWAAFIANGYGSYTGHAALYVVDVATGAVITELVADASETTGGNGLSSVKLKVDATSTVQAAYGGDLKGRMWKFDLSSTSISSWGVAFSGKPLFTAPGGTSQPITAQPLLVNNNTSGLMVYFGTGKFNETVDKTTTATQAFYAVWDKDGGAGNYTVSNLAAQAITGTFTSSGSTYMTTTSNTVDYTSQYGWYLPLTYNNTLVGERVIYQAVYLYGRILFTTAGVDTTDPCASQGFGRLVVLDALSGGELTTAVLDTNGDKKVTSADVASSGKIYTSGIPTLTAVVTISSTLAVATVQTSDGGPPDNPTINLPTGGGRIMWRQIQ